MSSLRAVFRASKGTPAKLAAEIADAIASKLGIEAQVIVNSIKELASIVAENALAADAADHSRLLVAFVQEPKALPALSAIEPFVVPPERFLVGKGAAYLHCAGGVLESKAGKALLKVGKTATTRNWTTVLKLQALASESDA